MSSAENRTLPDVIYFGPFRLSPVRRLLERDGGALQIGSRALDILIALVERSGEVVSNRDLMVRVWSDVAVDEGALRVHMVALRKTLGDGRDGARYVTNVPGRGYAFVAPVARGEVPQDLSATTEYKPQHNLPPRLARMVGRQETGDQIAAQLMARRFVTVVGPGGIGKTTLAVAIAHRLMPTEFDGAAYFIDFSVLHDPRMAASTLSSALGLAPRSVDPTDDLIAYLRGKRSLLVLDSCEHVVDAVSPLAERIFLEAPQVHILATSRESLRIEGEHVHRLFPLDYPPDAVGLSAAEAMAFPAVELFAGRVEAAAGVYVLTDIDAQVVAEICRKLDGIALAIEFAAGRVVAYGVREVSALLDSRLDVLSQGRRTAPRRHQTLTAALDWSYDLLSETERTMLRRLSVFVGFFALEAAQAVCAGDGIDRGRAAEAIGGLVEKSLISVDTATTAARYRLFDTTRAYAEDKLIENGEFDSVARRLALYFCDYLDRTDVRTLEHSQASQAVQVNSSYVGSMRAAMDWCFSDRGDRSLGAELTSVVANYFMQLCLWTEVQSITERALAHLDAALRETHREMLLLETLGLCALFVQGAQSDLPRILSKGIDLATRLDDGPAQIRLIDRLLSYNSRIGDARMVLELARQAKRTADRLADPFFKVQAGKLLGSATHLLGNDAEADAWCEEASRAPSGAVSRLHITYHYNILYTLARIRWARGYPERAIATARESIEIAEGMRHALCLADALVWTISIQLWSGDLVAAAALIERLIGDAKTLALTPFTWLATGFKGSLLIGQGEIASGIAHLRSCLAMPPSDRYELRTPEFSTVLAEALALSGASDEGLAVIDRTLDQIAGFGGSFMEADALRVKGEILRSMPAADFAGAEACFQRSRAVAHQQGALSWELRTATALAVLRAEQSRRGEARDLLAQVYGKFTEGFETADLTKARMLLNELAHPA